MTSRALVTTNKIISPHLFGFVPRSSTVHQLVYIIDKWTATRDNGGNFSATFMDFMKAFGRIWHTGCNGNPVGVRGQRGDRKIQGRQKMCRDRGSNLDLRNWPPAP